MISKELIEYDGRVALGKFLALFILLDYFWEYISPVFEFLIWLGGWVNWIEPTYVWLKTGIHDIVYSVLNFFF
jgi:hypothetical protein